jgi:hypothetical protein
MTLKHLRQRCEARLSELDLPSPFDVRRFCERLARRRGRPIVLQPVVSGTGCYGLWVAMPSADVVYYERETSLLHQGHIILHELCHLLSGHRPAPVSLEEAARLLLPDLQPELVRRLLQRAGYSTDEEREAEILASLILERAARTPPAPAGGGSYAAPHLDARTAQVLGRLETTLEGSPG